MLCVIISIFIFNILSAKGQTCVPQKTTFQLPQNVSFKDCSVSDEINEKNNILETWKFFSELIFLNYENVSGSCHDSFDVFKKGIENGEMWALKSKLQMINFFICI